MSDTERLEAAAAKLEQRAAYTESLDIAATEAVRTAVKGHSVQDRAAAGLLRALHADLAVFQHPSEKDWASDTDTVKAALALADAVLSE